MTTGDPAATELKNTSASVRIMVLVSAIGFLALAVICPFIWPWRLHLWWLSGLRNFLFLASGAILSHLIRRERLLTKSRQDYNLLFGSLLEPVLIHQDGTIIRANAHAVQFFEAADESELLGTSVLSFVHPDYRSVVDNRLRNLREGNPTKRIEEKFITLRGNVRDVEIAGIPTAFHGRHAVMILFRDITQRMQHQAELEDSQNRLRTLIDALPDKICLLDTEGRWIEANEPLLHSLRLKGVNFWGKTATELAHLCDPMFRHQLLANSQYPEQTFQIKTAFSHEYTTTNGTLIAHEIVRVPIRKDEGQSRGLVVIARDVSEQRLATKKLLESEQRYRSLFENDGDMIVSVDIKGVILSANPACEMTLGYQQTELVGRYYRELISPEHLNNSYQRFLRVIKGEPQRSTLALLHKNGQPILVSEKKVPILSNDNVTGYFCIVRDLTEQRAAEELLIKSERLSAVGQMAAGIAHEIRNPLTVLKGFVQLMQSTQTSKEFYLSVMNEEFQRIESILTELLVFAKPTMPRLELCRCEEMIQDIVRLMTPEAVLSDVLITHSIEDDTAQIICDKNRMKQVLVNVVKNAIEAMPQGGHIHLGVRSGCDDAVSVVIQDDGEGIPDELLPKVGDPFFTTKVKGTGLGLMVCRKIVEAHDGVFRIRSQVGVGTEVEIILQRASVGLSN